MAHFSLKQILKLSVLRVARTIGLFRLARFLTRDGLMIICWHGVSLTDEHERFRDLFITTESLAARLKMIQKNYEVIDLDEALRQHGQGRFKHRQVVLTFDDGFFNFFARAAPLLKSFGMTATVYLTTSRAEDQQPEPILLLRDLVLLAPQQEVRLACLDLSKPFRLATLEDRAGLTRLLKDALNMLPNDVPRRVQFVSEVADELGVDIDELMQRRVWHRMNEEELREIVQQGFAVEPHGHEHWNVVDYLDQTEENVRQCRERIRELTGRDGVHFCYPSGRWCREAWTMLSNAGISSATTGADGPNYPATPRLALRRVHNGESQCQLEFEFEMSNLRYLIRNLVNPRYRYTAPERESAVKTIEQKIMT